ncbi:MAG: hypothetical protein H7257_07315 [Taibaiella sp.]|nr:hypothetical protein [Taibaiella sp.]
MYEKFILQCLDEGKINEVNILPFVDAVNFDDSTSDLDKDAIYSLLSLYYYKKGDKATAMEYSGKINYAALFNKEKFADDEEVYF